VVQKPNKLLELEVKDEFGWDPMLDATRIVVNVDGGEVTLTGVVPTYDETVRADQDASRVGGIAAVDNQLMVGIIGSVITDEDVADDCVVSLDVDRVVPRAAVQVAVRNGWVTLSGEVRHHFQRAAAVQAIRRVRGVVGLTDCITFTHEPIPSDVAHRIEQAFERNAIIDHSQIVVSAADHTVYLDGTVPDQFAMNEAVNTAFLAPGVREVISRLAVSL
jgi:osmotically-inducible protein OsmY